MNRLTALFAVATGLAMAAMPAQAYEKGDWIIRGGVGVVDPSSTAYESVPDDLKIIVDSGTAVTLTGVYMLSPNWGFEILASTPFSHDIKAAAISEPGEIKIGETKHLPPTFSFQYHFMPDGKFQPYVGAGLNWTLFFDESIDETIFGTGASIKIDDSFGFAAQVGGDFLFGDRMTLNFDLRYIDISPDVTLTDPIEGSDTIGIDIDPIVYSVNLGFRF
jgi:outer membrane protein